jgi:hypothetical protein
MPAGDGRVRAAAGLISAPIMAMAAIAPEITLIFCVIIVDSLDEDCRRGER